MAEVRFRLSQREAKALAEDQDSQRRHGVRKSQARASAEFKLRTALFTAFPALPRADQVEGSE